MSAGKRVAVVLLGYLGAFAVGCAAVAVHVAVTQTPDRQSSMGMFAFGDTIVFLGALGFASLPATGAALFFLRGCPRFWTGLSALALVIAATGIVCGVAHFAPANASSSWVRNLAMFSPLRVLAAPVLGLGFFLSCVIAPSWGARLMLLAATASEAVLFTAVAIHWFWPTP